jgi:type I restriction enzyme M protein
VKVYVERELRAKRARKNIFSESFLKEQIGKDPLNDLFAKTREFYEDDQIFQEDEKVKELI